MPKSPAESAGVLIGYRVIAIEDVPVRKMNCLLLRSNLESEDPERSKITFFLSSTDGAHRQFVKTFESGTKRAC